MICNFCYRPGISQLLYDNQTESGRTINVFHRFNVFQELVLAGIYHGLSLQVGRSPSGVIQGWKDG